MTATTTRLPLPEASAFPSDLVALRQWTAFKFIGRGDKRTKLPVNPHTGEPASSIDPTTHGTFAQARAFAEPRGYGVELMIDPPLVLLDMDNCLDPVTGELTPMAAAIVAEVDTYWEVSVSGRGLKGIAYGTKPGGRCRRNGLQLEIYDHARPAALTGQRWADSPLAINDCTEAIGHIYGVAFPQPPPFPPSRGPSAPTNEDDAAVLDWLHEHRVGTFTPLWNGFVGDDHSAADLALCNLLAWRTGDPARVDRLFQQSGLYRPKWDERRGQQTYGERTVAKAFDGRTSFYTSPVPRSVPTVDEDRSSSTPATDERLAALEVENAELRRKVARLQKTLSSVILIRSNPHIKAERDTLQACVFDVMAEITNGHVDAEGWVRQPAERLAKTIGKGAKVVRSHLERGQEWDLLERKIVEERDPVSGARRTPYYVRLKATPEEIIDVLVTLKPTRIDKKTGEEKAEWGGERACSSCGSRNTRRATVIICDDCGHVSKPLEAHNGVIEAVPSAITSADLTDELVLDEADEQTASVPPTRVVVPSPPTYPPGEVSYHTAADSRDEEECEEEADAWDTFSCNYPECDAPLKLGQRYCDYHRERPYARKPTGIPLIAQASAAPPRVEIPPPEPDPPPDFVPPVGELVQTPDGPRHVVRLRDLR